MGIKIIIQMKTEVFLEAVRIRLLVRKAQEFDRLM